MAKGNLGLLAKKRKRPPVPVSSVPVSSAPASTNIRRVQIDELIPEPLNARIRGSRAKADLKSSVTEFGAARSLVMDGSGIVRAGNGTLEAAKAAGIEDVIVVEADGNQLVVVERADWTEEEAERYGLSDNKLGELSTWDDGILVDKLSRLVDAADVTSKAVPGFNVAELESFLGPLRDKTRHVEFDAVLNKLDGLEDAVITIIVPKKHEDEVKVWLSNGEGETAPQIGFGVMKRCGLL